METKTRTKGNVIVEEIKIGDIHYEYGYNACIKSVVQTLPKFSTDENVWRWKSKSVETGNPINYSVNPEYPHYSVNLYDYEAYVISQ